MTQNPERLAAQQGIRRARLNADVQDARYAPDLSLQLYANHEVHSSGDGQTVDQPDDGGDEQNAFADLRWVMPWWHKAGLKREAKKSAVAVDLQQTRSAALEKDIELQVYKAFLAAALTAKKLELVRNSVLVLEERSRAAQAAVRLGTGSILASQSEEANLYAKMVQANGLENELIEKKHALFTAMGAEPSDIALCTLPVETEVVRPSGLSSETALGEQTRLNAIEITQQGIEQEKQRQLWFPKIAARATYRRSADEIYSNDNQENVTIGVVLDVPLPNFAAERSELKLATEDLSGLYETRTAISSRTMRDIDRLDQSMASLSRQIAVLRGAISKQEDIERLNRRSFDLGRITSAELQLNETTVMNLKLDYYTNIYSHNVAVAEYIRLHGMRLPLGSPC